MCGFDSCYLCLVLLIFNLNRRKRHKIQKRRRGFLSKKTCFIVRRTKSFLLTKHHLIKEALSSRRTVAVQLRRRKVRRLRGYLRSQKRIKKPRYQYAQDVRYIPKALNSEILFARWNSTPTHKVIFFDKISHMVHKLLAHELEHHCIFRSSTTYLVDPSTLFIKFHTLKLFELFEFYKPFFYYTTSYNSSLNPTFHSLPTSKLWLNSQSQKLILFPTSNAQSLAHNANVFSTQPYSLNRLGSCQLPSKIIKPKRVVEHDLTSDPTSYLRHNTIRFGSVQFVIKFLSRRWQQKKLRRVSQSKKLTNPLRIKALGNKLGRRVIRSKKIKIQNAKKNLQKVTKDPSVLPAPKPRQFALVSESRSKQAWRKKQAEAEARRQKKQAMLNCTLYKRIFSIRGYRQYLHRVRRFKRRQALRRKFQKKYQKRRQIKVLSTFRANYLLKVCMRLKRLKVKPRKYTRFHIRKLRHNKHTKRLHIRPRSRKEQKYNGRTPLLVMKPELSTTAADKAYPTSGQIDKKKNLVWKRRVLHQIQRNKHLTPMFKWQVATKWTRFYQSTNAKRQAIKKSLLWQVLYQTEEKSDYVNLYSKDFLHRVAAEPTFNKKNLSLIQQQLTHNLVSQLEIRQQLPSRLSLHALSPKYPTYSITSVRLRNILQMSYNSRQTKSTLLKSLVSKRKATLFKLKTTSKRKKRRLFLWKYKLLNTYRKYAWRIPFQGFRKSWKVNSGGSISNYWLNQLQSKTETICTSPLKQLTSSEQIQLRAKLGRLKVQQKRLALRENSYLVFYNSTPLRKSIESNLEGGHVKNIRDLLFELRKLLLRSHSFKRILPTPTREIPSTQLNSKSKSRLKSKTHQRRTSCVRVLSQVLNFMNINSSWSAHKCGFRSLARQQWWNSLLQNLQFNHLKLSQPSTAEDREVSKGENLQLSDGEKLRQPRNFIEAQKYVTQMGLQEAFNRFYISQNRVQVSSYYISFYEFITNLRRRMRETEALYKMHGFRRNFHPLHQSFGSSYTRWLTQASDKYFETSVDFNVNNLTLTTLLEKRVGYRAKFASVQRYYHESAAQSIVHRRRALFNRGSFFKRPATIDYRSLASVTPTIVTSVNSLEFQNIYSLGKLISNPKFASLAITNKVLYKYLSFNPHDLATWSIVRSTRHTLKALSMDLSQTHFNSRVNTYASSNLLPAQVFKYSIRRRIFKLFKAYKFSVNVTMWYYNMLVRFMENCSGKKVYLKFDPFIENSLTFSDLARCTLWGPRVDGFQRILGPRIFVRESLKIFHLALRSQDPTFLANWFKGMLLRMSFWKYRLLFRYFKFVMRYFFSYYFQELGFKGLKIRLKGKVCVAGNARTRTLRYHIGETSYSTFANRISSDYSTLGTFTGVLGFRIWFFY